MKVYLEKEVQKFLDSINDSVRAKVMRSILLLSELGHKIRMPHSKKISDDLFELRIPGNVHIRIIYTYKNRGVVLLHAFKKKKQKIAKKEINTAEERLKRLNRL